MITRRVFLATSSAGLLGSAPSAGAQTANQGLKPARTNLLTFQPQYVGVFTSPAPGLTFSSLYNLEAQPSLVRLVFRNDIRSDETIDGVAVAPTAMAGDGFTPVNAEGNPDASLWKRVTFASDGDDTPPHVIKGAAAETIGVAGDASWGKDPPPSVFSDWVPITPLARRDGGKGCLLLMRTFSRGLFRNQFIRYQKVGGKEIGRDYAGFSSPGDGTRAPWSFSGQPSEISAAFAVQYQTGVPGGSVMVTGDSILAPPYAFGIGMRACTLASTPQLPVSFVNQAWLGARTEQFLFVARRELEWCRPQILVLQLWSGNDKVITEDTTDAVFAQAMSLVSFGLKKQCAPILVTTPPVPHFPVQEPFRQRSNAQIRAAAASKGLALLDLDKLWASETTPTTFRPGYTQDQMHGTEIACDVAARALAPLITRLLA
jgi:hypothetical protein